MSAINNQYLSGNADPQRVNECVLRIRYCPRLKLLHKVGGMNETSFENWN